MRDDKRFILDGFVFSTRKDYERACKEKETIEYSNMVMFNRFYLEDLRTICHPLKMQDLFIKPAIWSDYFKYKPKYFGLKLLRKHPKLIEWFIKDLKTKDYNFEK